MLLDDDEDEDDFRDNVHHSRLLTMKDLSSDKLRESFHDGHGHDRGHDHDHGHGYYYVLSRNHHRHLKFLLFLIRII